MDCGQLVISNFSCIELDGGTVRVNTHVKLEADVTNEGPVGCCRRSGSVTFNWLDYATHNVLATLGSESFGALGSGEEASAICIWKPASPMSGYVQAVLTEDPANCDGQECTSPVPSASNGMICCVYAKIAPANGAAQREYRHYKRHGITHLGFGLVGSDAQATLRARVVQIEKLHNFVEPHLALASGAPRDLAQGRTFHAGTIDLDSDLATEVAFKREIELRDRKGDQGVLEVRWPNDSEGRRTLIEVWEEVAGRRVGGFTIGLRNVAPHRRNAIWC